jgi:GAF domain-containing protein
MAMRATTIRFPDAIWQLLEGEAQAEGVSAAQFIRDATILRIGAVKARRGDGAALADLREMADHDAGEASATAPQPDPTQAALLDAERLAALHESGALAPSSREGLDRIARMAAEALNAPVALVSLVDADRQRFGGCVGLTEPWATDRETPLSHSFCQHAVASREPFVVADAREHPTVRDNAAVRDLGVIAYAGVPLIDRDGNALGTLCVIDHKPRTWSRQELAVLEDLTASAMSEIELAATRRQLSRLRESRAG